MNILRLADLQTLTGLSRTTLWRIERRKGSEFPKRIRLGSHSVGWIESEVHAWLASRPRGFSSQNTSARG